MSIDELLALRRQEARRLADSVPSSPEWDAAMASVEDLDEELRALHVDPNEPTNPRPQTTVVGSSRGDL